MSDTLDRTRQLQLVCAIEEEVSAFMRADETKPYGVKRADKAVDAIIEFAKQLEMNRKK